MKAKIYDWSTDIYPNEEEVKELCRPGEGANTCVWLLIGSNGFECACHNRPPTLLNRWTKGETTAKRDGCDIVNNFSPADVENYHSGIEVEIK
jgi:hypothetical protein